MIDSWAKLFILLATVEVLTAVAAVIYSFFQQDTILYDGEKTRKIALKIMIAAGVFLITAIMLF